MGSTCSSCAQALLAHPVLGHACSDYAAEWFSQHGAAVASFCSGDTRAAVDCARGQIAFRVSFANVCFFSVHALFLFMAKRQEDPRVRLHTSFWAIKILVWAGALAGRWQPPRPTLLHRPALAAHAQHCLLPSVVAAMRTPAYKAPYCAAAGFFFVPGRIITGYAQVWAAIVCTCAAQGLRLARVCHCAECCAHTANALLGWCSSLGERWQRSPCGMSGNSVLPACTPTAPPLQVARVAAGLYLMLQVAMVTRVAT